MIISRNKNSVSTLLIGIIGIASAFLAVQSWILPLVFVIILIFSVLAIRHPQKAILLIFLTKPVIDATWYFRIPFLGLNFLQISGVIVPALILLLIYSYKVKIFEYRLTKIFFIVVLSSAISYVSYMIGSIDSSSSFVNRIVFGLVTFLQFVNGFAMFCILPYLFKTDQERQTLFLVLMLSGLFPMVTAYLQIFGIMEGRELRTTGNLIRISGFYYDSSNLRFYAMQMIIAIFIYAEGIRHRANSYNRLISIVLSITIGLLLYVMYRGYSKSALIILFTWIIIYALFKKKLLLGAALIVGASSIYLTNPVVSNEIDRLLYKEQAYIEGRLPEQLEYTLLGGRLKQWKNYLDQFESESFVNQLIGYSFIEGAPTHNDFVRMLISNGYLGLLSYCIFLLFLISVLLKAFFQNKDNLSIGAIMIFIAFFIDSLGLTPSIYTGYSWFVFGLISLSINREQLKDKKLK